MNLELQGKRALVTGGSRGIGKAVARVLAQEGAVVALLTRDASRLASCADELAAETGQRVIGVRTDTTDDAQVMAANTIDHLVDAEEVARVIAFLCSPKSRAINGDAIVVGGGAKGNIHY